MQPPRDPHDTRYLPATAGGTGSGFTTHGKRASSVFAADATPDRHGNGARRRRALVTADSIDTGRTPEAVRRQARAVLLLAVARIEDRLLDDDAPATLTELSQTVGALGRVSGVNADTGASGVVTINLVRRATATAVDATESQRLCTGEAEAVHIEGAPDDDDEHA